MIDAGRRHVLQAVEGQQMVVQASEGALPRGVPPPARGGRQDRPLHTAARQCDTPPTATAAPATATATASSATATI